MLPKTVQEFYPFAVHTIYAVIITLSFEVASRLLIPINNVFSSWDNILRSTGLTLAYIIIISGWIGYTKSISRRPHSENRLGNARFVMDLVILFLVFYLMSFANAERVPSFTDAFKSYIWIFPILFGAYIIWDALKYYEYKHCADEKQTSLNRGRKTVYAFILFILQASVYSYIVPMCYDKFKWGENPLWELFFVGTTLMIILLYRKSKWIIPDFADLKKPRHRRMSNKEKVTEKKPKK